MEVPKAPIKRNPKNNSHKCDCNCRCHMRNTYANLAPKRIKTENGYSLACPHFSSCPYSGNMCAFASVKDRKSILNTCEKYGVNLIMPLDLEKDNIF